MSLEKALFYFTHHSEAIIQWLFLVILLLAVLLVSRSLFGKKKMSLAGAGADAGELQGFLETILERTSKLEGVSVQGMDRAGFANLEAQLQFLKKDLAARESEIAAMTRSGASASAGLSADGVAGGGGGAPMNAEELAKLNSRIAELEAKLSEYEILEDDIADLSLYKDENARMRVELDKLKASPAAASVEASAPLAAPAPAPATAPAQAEAIMAEFAQAIEAEPIKSTGEPVKIASTGNNMADFESTLNLAKKMSGAPANSTSGVVEESEDLFAEFASEGDAADEALDTSKVMDELNALENLADSAADGGRALDESIDTEKMAAEASSLTTKS